MKDICVCAMQRPFQIPQILGHKYIFDELLDMNLLNTRYANHRRLRVFHHKGRNCINATCNKVGTYLIKARNHAGGFHIDLYTEEFELMTIDHILPKSKGGKDTLENLQPMCHSCNAQKADKV